MENNYQLSRIHNYVNGLMSKDDMYALEREALEDPFLQDAIDGYKMQNGVDTKQLSLLQQRLATRLQTHEQGKNRRFYSWQRLAIGMAAAVMFVTVCTLVLMRYLPKQKAADLKEVVLSEFVYDYHITPNHASNNAVPIGGWDILQEKLVGNYSNGQSFDGQVSISFKVDANQKATDIVIVGYGFEKDEELEDIIRNKVKWEGSQGDFILNIRKVNP